MQKKPYVPENSGSHHSHKSGSGHNHNGHIHKVGNFGYRGNGQGGSGHNHPLNGNNSGKEQHRHNNEPKRDISQVTCYKCGNKGHYSTDCPEKKKVPEASKPNPFQKAQVNHLDVEEVQNEPDAVIGTFLLHTFPALVLFDTGASHSFISRAFVNKNKLTTTSLLNTVRVSSPGGKCSHKPTVKT